MKKTFLFLILTIFSSSGFASENFTLSCEGTQTIVLKSGKNGEKELSPTKIATSYIFKDGALLKGKQRINCIWSDEDIQCEELGLKPYSINMYALINRITGYTESMTSYLDGKGEFITRDLFTGICKKSSKKF